MAVRPIAENRRSRFTSPFSRLRGQLRGFEPLETRANLAIAALGILLYEDHGGIPGKALDQGSVVAGDSFFASIRFREFHPFIHGFTLISVNVAWNPSLLRVLDAGPSATWDNAIISSDLPIQRPAQLNQDSGWLVNLEGLALSPLGLGRPLGDEQWEQFALMRFAALKPVDATTITLSEGSSGFVSNQGTSISASRIRLELPSLTILPSVSSLQAVGAANHSEAVPIESVLVGLSTMTVAPEDQLERDGVCVPWTAMETTSHAGSANTIGEGEGEAAGDASAVWAVGCIAAEGCWGTTLATPNYPATTNDHAFETRRDIDRENAPFQFPQVTLRLDLSAATKCLVPLYANCVDELMRQEPAALWNP